LIRAESEIGDDPRLPASGRQAPAAYPQDRSTQKNLDSSMEETVANQKAIIEEYISAYNELDIERMLKYIHQEVEFQNVSGGEVNAVTNGIEELRKMAEQSRQLFSSRHQSIESFEEQGGIITVRIKFKAILAVDLPNGSKAGDSLSLEGKSIFEFKDRKLWRISDYS
jgi:hypothetical protein